MATIYVAHPVEPSKEEILRHSDQGSEARAYQLAWAANVRLAIRWYAWLRKSFPDTAFEMPWLADAMLPYPDAQDLVAGWATHARFDGVVLVGSRISANMDGAVRLARAARGPERAPSVHDVTWWCGDHGIPDVSGELSWGFEELVPRLRAAHPGTYARSPGATMAILSSDWVTARVAPCESDRPEPPTAASPAVGGRVVATGPYRHFRGGAYWVTNVAEHTETGESHVVYLASTESTGGRPKYWVRPASMFTDSVEVDGRLVPRFAPLGESTAAEISIADDSSPGVSERPRGQGAPAPPGRRDEILSALADLDDDAGTLTEALSAVVDRALAEDAGATAAQVRERIAFVMVDGRLVPCLEALEDEPAVKIARPDLPEAKEWDPEAQDRGDGSPETSDYVDGWNDALGQVASRLAERVEASPAPVTPTRRTEVAGMSKDQVRALLKEEPSRAAPGSPELAEYRARPAALVGAEYDAWVDHLSKQRPEDTE